MFSIILGFVIIGLILLYIFGTKKDDKGNWVHFLTKGREAGFSIREMEYLRKLAISCNVDDPASIFKSQKKLEICIKSLVQTVRTSSGYEEPGIHSLLSKLFDYYKKREMESAEIKTSITSSRQISEGQVLRVLVPGTGVYVSEVIKNTGAFITISRPVNNKISTALQWNGLKISVYFWREEDAGYVFDSEVIDEVFSKGISSLKVIQNDSLFRTQKRKSMRLKVRKPAYLYLASADDYSGNVERKPGLNCMLDDISDTGCAFHIKGQASSGMRLKVQFGLNRVPICMVGTIRSVDYNGEADSSLAHMEADPLPIEMRNQILGEVFQMMPDADEDELPFRELEEAADNISEGEVQAAEEVKN